MGELYDVVIVGAGPAGLTAALYSLRANLKTIIIAKELGGTANSILSIENWPGFNGKGRDLMKQFYDQLKPYKPTVVLENVLEIKRGKKDFAIKTENREIEGRAIIVATGTKRKDLKIPGEEKLVGKGVSYCATCDGFFFREKDVAFIAKEDCGTNEIFELAKLANKVYVLTTGKLKCEKELKKSIEKEKIEVMNDTIATEIKGEEKVEGLIVKTKKEEKELKIDGLFIDIGSASLTEFSKRLGLKLDKDSNIIVDDKMETSVAGVFSAGDVTNSKFKQVLVASSQGAIAAKGVQAYLSKDSK
jgi:thioredoxin-disulfide reductase